MPRFLVRNRRKLTVFGIVGALLAGAGIAVAAFLLTTSIGGQTGYTDSTASDVIVSAVGSSTGSVDCSDATTDGNSISVNPKVARFSVQGGPATITPGSCTIVVKVKNTGTAPLYVNGVVFDQIPAGWTSKPDYPAGSITAGATSGDVTITLSASDSAASGGLAGRLLVGGDPATSTTG